MKVNVAIGFVTGRKQFQNVLRSYINNWLEHGLVSNKQIRLHIFVAYDLKYHGTQISDYKNIPQELAAMVDSISFYDTKTVDAELAELMAKGLLDKREGKLLFGEGYGKKRNIVTYFAVKKKMDRLIFIDDDEYPLATLKNDVGKLMWMGQSVVGTHLEHISDAHITHGHHCGYISPIPFIRYNEALSENDMRLFIEAISNDIISWEKILDLTTNHKGVTYANGEIINASVVSEVEEIDGMKFISGANLCFNLKRAADLPPFYNPPGARGEDTFMSTALSDLKVLKIPCYTFHDGFSTYQNLLNGVLPTSLEAIDSKSDTILRRFINAAIGWIRYKPLLVYITQQSNFETSMESIEHNLILTIPKLKSYFRTEDFDRVLQEFLHYKKNVKKHFQDFQHTKEAWRRLIGSLMAEQTNHIVE